MPSATDSGSRTSSARCVILWSTLILWSCLCSIHLFGLTPCHIWPHCDTQHPSWNPKSMLVPPLGSHRHHELSQCHHHWDVSLWKKKPARRTCLDAQSPMVAIEAPNTQSWLAKQQLVRAKQSNAEQSRAKRTSQNVMKVRVATPHNAAMMYTQQISVHSLHYAVKTPKARFPNHWMILSYPNYSQCSQHSQCKLLVHMSSILDEKINVYQGHS